MLNPESVLKNEMSEFLWDFEIQTDHLISARRIDVEENQPNMGILPTQQTVELPESEKRNRYLHLARKLKKKKI